MSFSFIFAIHNHQPVGNFERVIERAFGDCYRPFLEKVMDHPWFKFCLHFSGPLWEYMEEHDRACLEMVRKLVGRGQAELLGGAFYEPVLTIIPEEDCLGQLEMMSDFLELNFGRRPRGIWISERVWEPHLASILARAGVEYTFLDEEHFHSAGMKDIHRAYFTEDQGRYLSLFPIDKKLRYLIPFQPVGEVEAALEEIRKAGGTAILGDDGEKFGLWPGTHKSVYQSGWLDGFLALLKEKDVKMMTCSEYLEENPARRLVYIPPCSYEEMTEWVLEPEELNSFRLLKEQVGPAGRRFLRGGFFRDFLRKYPEAGLLHNRMLLASSAIRKEGRASETAVRELYRSQCNDAYWHGVFGGLYLPHLREASFGSLVRAEIQAGLSSFDWRYLDLDGDGEQEVYSRKRSFNMFVKPGRGGSVLEIDYLPAGRNITDVLSRRRESYHFPAAGQGRAGGKSIHELERKIPPEAGSLLEYDDGPRLSSVDRFFSDQALARLSFRLGDSDLGDFASGKYEAEIETENLILHRAGRVETNGLSLAAVVRKTITNAEDFVSLRWEISWPEAVPEGLTFCSEWNVLAFPEEIDFDPEENSVRLYGGRIIFEPSDQALTRIFPLRTLSQSEKGYDIIHQGFCICFIWPISGNADLVSKPELKIRDASIL